MKQLLLFFVTIFSVSAQNLQFIPDENLRNELKRQGFFFNESLYIPSTKNVRELNLDGKGIENLDGLQYFAQLSTLNINNNKIKRLDYLPPFLSVLYCANNEIERIDSLPCCIHFLGLENNKLNFICKLPHSLTAISFYNNQMTYFPNIPANVEYINYSNNPIPLDSIPNPYKDVACIDISQNCLPFRLRNWKILNVNLMDSVYNIIGMKVQLHARYGWGQGSHTRTTDFKSKKGMLKASKTRITIQNNGKEKTTYIRTKYSFEIMNFSGLLNDIALKKTNFEFLINDTIKQINLENKKDGITCYSLCADCTGYGFIYSIYTKTDTINISYSFETEFSLCYDSKVQNIKAVVDWFYFYKLVNMTIPNDEIVKRYFNSKILDRIITGIN